MNNDLISREALRNEVDTWGCNDYDKYDFLDAIDNAPTVTPDKIQAIMSDYLVYRCEPQRPRGEWIEHEDSYNTCPLCRYNTAFSYNFCPNCGADMRGE